MPRHLILTAATALTLTCLATPALAQPATKSIAVTIDDLPFQPEGFSIQAAREQAIRLLRVLSAHHVEAIGFVNEDKLFVAGEADARIALLADWLDAGMQLGNHGFGHLSFQQTPLPAYEDGVIKGEAVTRQLLAARGMALRYYRYPYNQTGRTLEDRDGFVDFLTSRGYSIAPFTIEDDDTIFARVYADDIQNGRPAEAARVRASYLANLDKSLDTFETMSQSLFSRQISQVLLIHANRLNADTLDMTLGRLEQRNYRFVAYGTALSDAAYASPDGYVGPYGPSWLRRWADGLHRSISPLGQPDPEEWVLKRFAEINAAHPGSAD